MSKYKGGLTPLEVSSADAQERIRQTKVSKFILKRVSELESESLKMRDELDQLSRAQLKQLPKRERRSADSKQEDLDFDEPAAPTTTTTTTTQAASSTTQQGMPATTTMKPEEEAAKIGFDIEALKKLGEEIGKRLDQFGKEAAKNLGDLIEGVKLVFREPTSPKPPPPVVTPPPAVTAAASGKKKLMPTSTTTTTAMPPAARFSAPRISN